MNRDAIRGFIKEHGLEAFQREFKVMINEGTLLPNGQKVRIDPNRLSLRSMWEGMVGPVDMTLPWGGNGSMQEASALDYTGFPTATGELISRVMISGYETRRGIADILVPVTDRPDTLTERIMGWTAFSSPSITLPGQPYDLADFGEKYVTFEQALHNKKEGIEIAVTEEVVRFDQTRQILQKAGDVGMSIQTERERRTVRAVLGVGLDTGTVQNYVYFPSGVDSALYTAGQNNLRTNAAPIYNHPGKTADSVLEDYTDIQEVLTVHAQNIRDDRQLGTTRPIAWMPDTILAPLSLAATAARIINSTEIRYTSTERTAGTNPDINTIGGNLLAGMFNAFGGQVPTPMTSVYVDEVSATVWIMFDRQRTFVRMEVFPFQTFRAPVGYGWNRDILTSVRAREWSRVVAKDFRVCVRNNGA